MDPSLSDAEVQARFARHLQMQIEHILVLLGRIPLPGMDGMEPRLAEARELIDNLEALEVKTRGNLRPQEQAFLAGALSELRLAYVEASHGRGQASSAPSAAKAAGNEAAVPPQTHPVEPEQEGASAEDDKRKFFKSYG